MWAARPTVTGGECAAKGLAGLGPPKSVCSWDQPDNVAPLPSAHPTLHRERSKKKKKKLEKQVKGKGDKKGATSKSSSSKSPAKGMSDSFKSKEFVSSDESSSAESKKEVGSLGEVLVPFPWGITVWEGPSPSSLGNILVISAGEAGSF